MRRARRRAMARRLPTRLCATHDGLRYSVSIAAACRCGLIHNEQEARRLLRALPSRREARAGARVDVITTRRLPSTRHH